MEKEIKMSLIEYNELLEENQKLKKSLLDKGYIAYDKLGSWGYSVRYFTKDAAIKELVEHLTSEISKRVDAETELELLKQKRKFSWF